MTHENWVKCVEVYEEGIPVNFEEAHINLVVECAEIGHLTNGR